MLTTMILQHIEILVARCYPNGHWSEAHGVILLTEHTKHTPFRLRRYFLLMVISSPYLVVAGDVILDDHG